jgi:ArsR family transcriptional regulator
MHYSIEHSTHQGAAAILAAVFSSFEADREMQSDLARLNKACCEPQRFVTLKDVPMPASWPERELN